MGEKRWEEIKQEIKHNDPAKASKDKIFVLLISGFRTGSTFIGELFNQNPSALYLFEPIHQNHIAALMKRNLIHGVPKDSSLLEQRTFYLDQIINRCEIGDDVNFKGMIKMMQCGETAADNMARFGTVVCDEGPGRWDRACKRRDMVVMKLIRLQRIQHLELIPGIKDANIRVIHLIRDPRGTMNSRRKFGTFYLDDLENLKVNPLTPEKMGIAAANLCDREWDNIQYTEKLPEWLRGRFMRITHDEMSLDPIGTAKAVYEFVGQTMPKSMETMLIEHTSTAGHGVLNTFRNSTEILEKWKSELQLPIV